MLSTRLTTALSLVLVGSFAHLSTVSAAESIGLRSVEQAPLTFQLSNNTLIIVKGSIGTITDLNIVLDTGTSPTTVSREIADRLHLRGNPELLLTLNGTAPVQKVIVPSIQIGGLHADSLVVGVQDLSFLEKELGVPVEGIAGLDLLSGTNFTIDYQKRQIFLGRLAATKKSIHFEKLVPFLTVKAKIDGQEFRLLVDSGFPGLLICRTHLKPGFQPRYFYQTLIETATGRTQSQWFLASTVSLGKQNLGQQAVVIADSGRAGDDFDGLLGFVNLGFHRVTFDFENGLLGWD